MTMFPELEDTAEVVAARAEIDSLGQQLQAAEIDTITYLVKIRHPHRILTGWKPASETASAEARSRFGDDAVFGYTLTDPSRSERAGRRYYVHVDSQESPVRTLHLADSDLEQLARRHGEDRDRVILGQMCQ